MTPWKNYNVNIKGHWSQITVKIIMKKLKYCENYQNVTQRQKVRSFWKKSADRLTWCRVATNLQFVKKCVKCNKMKHNKTRYACMHLTKSSFKMTNNSFFSFLKKSLFIYLFLAALVLRCCAWAFSSCSERGLLFVVVHGLLIAVASFVVEHGF